MKEDKKVLYDTPRARGASKPCRHAYAYDLVYILDAKHKYAFIFGKSESGRQSADLSGAPHKIYHAAALDGKEVSYEWSFGGRDYRTCLLPLGGGGDVTNVLGIVKELNCACEAGIVRDRATPTFSQLLLKAREDEKKKIAGALHDEIGTSAVILTSALSVLEEDIKENKGRQALSRARDLDLKIKECVDRIKNLVVTMRPPNIDSAGLEGAVKELVEQLNGVSPVKIVYEYKEEYGGFIDDEVKIVLYRAVQESLNNALKHAKASKIKVVLQNMQNSVKIRVEDDGKGFSLSRKQTFGHLGLPGMKESVKYLGGSFKIQTTLGKGTAVLISCPKIVYKVDI